jgi:hypothetical protein
MHLKNQCECDVSLCLWPYLGLHIVGLFAGLPNHERCIYLLLAVRAIRNFYGRNPQSFNWSGSPEGRPGCEGHLFFHFHLVQQNFNLLVHGLLP